VIFSCLGMDELHDLTVRMQHTAAELAHVVHQVERAVQSGPQEVIAAADSWWPETHRQLAATGEELEGWARALSRNLDEMRAVSL
jgi:hypothetical protein